MARMLDKGKLAVAVRGRRGGESLRAAAKNAGVSHQTLHNVEQGKDVGEGATLRILAWLRIPTEFFMAEGGGINASGPPEKASH